MRHLSKVAGTAFIVLALTGAGFMKKPATRSIPASPAILTANAASYWWYSAFDGSYNDYENLSWEIWEMEIFYDCVVNTTPGGGMLIEKGYWPVNNPNNPVMQYLYAHF